MRKKVITLLFVLIWILPVYFFTRDFFSFDTFFSSFNYKTLKILLFTLYQSSISTFFALLIGIIPGYYVSRSNSKLGTILESLTFIPFFFPAVSTVVAFTILFNIPLLKDLHILYSLKAIVLANIFYNAPIFVRYISIGLSSTPREVVEASKVDGVSFINRFIHIELPFLKPLLMKGLFLVFSYSFSSLVIIMSLGGISFTTLEVEIANTLISTSDFSYALALGGIQFLFLTIINVLSMTGSDLDHIYVKNIGPTSFFTKFISIIYLVFEVVVVGTGLIFSFYNIFSKRFSLGGIVTLFSRDFQDKFPVIESIINSFLLGIIASIGIVVVSYILLKNFCKLTHFVAYGTLGISGAFIGIILIYTNILYDIPYFLLLICGYIIVGVPIAYSLLSQHVIGFPREIIEAARVDGASSLSIFFKIELPILKKPLMAVFLQCFALVFGEFTIPYTMQIGGSIPLLPLLSYSMVTKKMFTLASTLSGISIIIIFTTFLLGRHLQRD